MIPKIQILEVHELSRVILDVASHLVFRVHISNARAAYRELSASARGKRNMLDEAGEILDVDAIFGQQGHLKTDRQNPGIQDLFTSKLLGFVDVNCLPIYGILGVDLSPYGT